METQDDRKQRFASREFGRGAVMSARYRFVWDEIVTYETYITAGSEAEARQLFEDGNFTTYGSLDTQDIGNYEVEVEPTEILCGDCLYPIDKCYHGTQR